MSAPAASTASESRSLRCEIGSLMVLVLPGVAAAGCLHMKQDATISSITRYWYLIILVFIIPGALCRKQGVIVLGTSLRKMVNCGCFVTCSDSNRVRDTASTVIDSTSSRIPLSTIGHVHSFRCGAAF